MKNQKKCLEYLDKAHKEIKNIDWECRPKNVGWHSFLNNFLINRSSSNIQFFSFFFN